MVKEQQKIIGLFGGSFNPPHQGHVHISTEAKKLLRLDEVWWLISPQNPFKGEKAPSIDKRLALCDEITKTKNFITAITAEQNLGNISKTYNTVCYLKELYPNYTFIWIMGADSMIDFHKWHRSDELFHSIPFAIFDRPNYMHKALSSKTAIRYKKNRIADSESFYLSQKHAPAWCFLPIRTNALSSTQMRST